MNNRLLLRILAVLLLAAGWLLPAVQVVQAQVGSAMDLVNAVNAYRANYDLAPYVVDASLMTIAQSHSEYQASIGKLTHERADGKTPADLGITSENIGGGPNTSVRTLIDYQWSDYWHTHTLVGYTAGQVGAGVAVVNGYAYYTLIVMRTGVQTYLLETLAVSTSSAPAGSTTGVAPAVQKTATPFATVTARPDNALVHTVNPGETLWSIAKAYSTTIDNLKSINGLTEDAPTIYAGQTLYIRLPDPATATPTITNTPLPPTRTPDPTRTPRLLLPSPTPETTGAPTSLALLPQGEDEGLVDRKTLGFWVLALCLVGLVAVFLATIRRR